MAAQPQQIVVTRVLADPVRMYLPNQYWDRARDWFSFNLDITLNAAAGIVAGSFTIQNDSDFLVLCISGTAATAAAGTAEQPYWPYLINIQDTSSGGSWFNADSGNGFTHVQNIVGRFAGGTAAVALSDPGRLEHPRFVPRGGTVTVQLNNLSATANRVWLSFRGIKIYSSLRQGA